MQTVQQQDSRPHKRQGLKLTDQLGSACNRCCPRRLAEREVESMVQGRMDKNEFSVHNIHDDQNDLAYWLSELPRIEFLPLK